MEFLQERKKDVGKLEKERKNDIEIEKRRKKGKDRLK